MSPMKNVVAVLLVVLIAVVLFGRKREAHRYELKEVQDGSKVYQERIDLDSGTECIVGLSEDIFITEGKTYPGGRLIKGCIHDN
jgi:hypothetical protein